MEERVRQKTYQRLVLIDLKNKNSSHVISHRWNFFRLYFLRHYEFKAFIRNIRDFMANRRVQTTKQRLSLPRIFDKRM